MTTPTSRHARTIAAGAAAVLLLVLTGCGGDDGGPGTAEPSSGTVSPGSTAAPDAPAAAEAFPVTIEHALGTTEIANRPERVVTIGYGEGDIVAALGVVPLAVNAYGTRDGVPAPWLVDRVDGADVELLQMVDGIPYERLAALDPDVILALTSDIDAADYDLLSQIAPTVAYQTGPFQDSWQDAAIVAGQALGEEERARQLVDGVEDDVVAAATDNPELTGRTVTVALAISPDQVGVLNSPQENTVRLLTELGMELPPAVADLEIGPTGYSAVISREQVGVLDADVLLMYAINDNARQALLAEPVFNGLAVVGRGDVLAIEPDVWAALRTPSVLAIPYALDRLIEPLTTALSR